MTKTLKFDSEKQYEDLCFLLNVGAEQFTRSLLIRKRANLNLNEIAAILNKVKPAKKTSIRRKG